MIKIYAVRNLTKLCPGVNVLGFVVKMFQTFILLTLTRRLPVHILTHGAGGGVGRIDEHAQPIITFPQWWVFEHRAYKLLIQRFLN